jgi:hypothetical protein
MCMRIDIARHSELGMREPIVQDTYVQVLSNCKRSLGTWMILTASLVILHQLNEMHMNILLKNSSELAHLNKKSH